MREVPTTTVKHKNSNIYIVKILAIMTKNFRTYAFLAGAFLAGATVTAQKARKITDATDVNAAIKGIEKIVTHTLKDVEPVVSQICEAQQGKNKKCPEVYVGAANAFWTKSGVSDTTYAQKYIDKAIAIDPHYGPAYTLRADIYKWAEDTATAVNWYKKALEMAPTDLRVYRSYIAFNEKGLDKLAKLAMEFEDPGEIAEVKRRRGVIEDILKKAKEAMPDYPYEREYARLYANYAITTNEVKEGIQMYEKANKDSLISDDYASLARMVYTFVDGADGNTKLNHYKRIINVCDSGLQRYPSDYYLLSNGADYAIKAYELVRNQKGDVLYEYKNLFSSRALDYSEHLMATKDTMISDLDHFRYGKALVYKNKTNDGIDELKKLLESPTVKDDVVAATMGVISNAYKDLGEYDKAEEMFDQYLKALEQKGTLQYYHLQNYAKLFEDKAEESVGNEQIAAYRKAFDMYGKGADKFPEYAHYGYSAQLRLAEEFLDTDKKAGLALEPAKKLYALAKAKGESLKEYERYACQYLALYYLDKNKATAKPYWLRLHELNPDNEQIKKNIFILYKIKV